MHEAGMTDLRSPIGARTAIDARKLGARLRESRAVDLDAVGRIVAEMGPTLQGVGGDVMDTYIVDINDKVCQLFKLSKLESGAAPIERVTLQAMLSRVQR
jgi:hypothetical protein